MYLAIVWSEVGIKVLQLLLSLSILVILHEFGHYITARWFGCRVEKFYLFFDPWFSLFKKKVGETEYGIGWLPLGGYVKISGMIDESMDKEALALPAQPWEFRSKPAWQRLIIMIGGVTVNVLLAFLLYAMILFVWGEQKTVNSSMKAGVWITDSLMYEIGFKNGDQVVAVNNTAVPYFEDVPKKILFGGGNNTVQIKRNGKDTAINIPVDVIGKLVEKRRSKLPLFIQRLPAISGSFGATDTTNAQKAGLQYWDKIVAVDSTPVTYLDEVTAYTTSRAKQPITLSVMRNGNLVKLPATVNEFGKLGIPFLAEEQYDSLGVFKLDKKEYGFFQAIPAGVKMAFNTLSDYVDQFKLILKPSTGAYKGVGGFKSMGSIFSSQWEWESFWKITAFFSIVLAFMNLLPIPALDGGHVMFTLYEMITGRKPNQKFLEYAQVVGMVLLLGLMLYANGNDWLGWGRGK